MSLYEIDHSVTQRRLAAITGSGLRDLRERAQRSAEIDKHVRDMLARHERERQAIDEQLTTLELPSAGVLDLVEVGPAPRGGPVDDHPDETAEPTGDERAAATDPPATAEPAAANQAESDDDWADEPLDDIGTTPADESADDSASGRHRPRRSRGGRRRLR